MVRIAIEENKVVFQMSFTSSQKVNFLVYAPSYIRIETQIRKNHNTWLNRIDNAGNLGTNNRRLVRMINASAAMKKRMTMSDKKSIIVPNLRREDRMRIIL